MSLVETWAAGPGRTYIYTETPEFARSLRQVCGRGTTYERRGRVCAWQHLIPTGRLPFYLQLSRKEKDGKICIKNKELTEAPLTEFAFKRANSPRSVSEGASESVPGHSRDNKRRATA